MTNSRYFDATRVASYNGIFTHVISNRNYGKTWGFKKRAWVRALKRGKKTIWVRRFKKEVKEAAPTFYASADLLTFIKTLIPYDSETKKGNFKQNGNTFYVKRGRHWTWFLKIVALSDANALRSADDVNCDTIIFDEYTTTPEKYARYRGNEVNDFCDMFFSAKRNHKVRCFFLGNNENVANPYLTYFGIKPLPMTFEGLRTYRHGSIVIQKINNKPVIENKYDKGVQDLFSGTVYGDYIYADKYRTGGNLKCCKTPHDVTLYAQIAYNSVPLAIKTDGCRFYCCSAIDKTQPVYCGGDTNVNIYPRSYVLVKRNRVLFNAFISAIADNRVKYENHAAYEAMIQFRKWLAV